MLQRALPFGLEEYADRLARTRASMAARGIDLLIVVDPANMAWLTGYDGWSFYVHQGVIVPMDGDPIWWGRGIDENGARLTTWLADDNIRAYADDFVQSRERHPMEDLSRLIAAEGWDKGRIGVEMDCFQFPAAAFAALRRGLPDARFVDAGGLVNWLRSVKSAQEIAFMRKAARIVESMYDVIFARARPGLRKNELVGDLVRAGIVGTDAFGGDYPAIAPIVPSGEEASTSHLTWNDKPLRKGEATYFEIAGCHRRYHAPLCRTIHLGKPPAHVLNAEAALLDGLAAGIEAARAGNRACDVAAALFAVFERAGIAKDSRCGYSVGLGYPPDWGERTISFRRSDETELKPGMTFHFMPGIWADGWGVAITETILIRETGAAEPLADVPRAICVIE
ncbi:M24 family metallopeptidase [Oceanicella actignis]|uniref:Ectoine hydrolase n=1 Tax=Oceanicella actignis TaxID=1189325 RepID=A0A1M7TPC2_9RHOB|nr:M24 family metallopeptidase [Oceanicella actignis]SET73659.1 ectoine hydrolase [Oceanicella actignis]SHN72587.1 ectoine hydrolase [Oceanicella actignis]